jgi:adenine-specific DNA-methyltransferase
MTGKSPKPAQVKTEVKVTAAKGRPMLSWVGKRPLSRVTAFPAQLVERHDAFGIAGLPHHDAKGNPQMGFLRALRANYNAKCWENEPSISPPVQELGGLLLHGDNKDVLAYLLANGYRGAVDLVYIDPPFDSGADYVRKVSLRGAKREAKIDGEGYTLGEQIQYTDIWANDNYLQFMYERLQLIKELLAEHGSIYLHSDWHRNHQLRCLLDEIFGAERFVNEIVWQRTASHNDPGRYGVVHDIIHFFAKSDNYRWNDPKVPQSEE